MTLLEAVQQVPHRADCGVTRMTGMTECLAWQARCSCDWRERIAKGIEAAAREAYECADSWYFDDARTFILPAFIQAAAL